MIPKPRIGNERRIARLLLEDVTLRREQDTREALVQLRFRGGVTRELRVPLPKPSWALKQTKAEVVSEIDRLLDTHTEQEIAHQLNERVAGVLEVDFLSRCGLSMGSGEITT